jgi:hypothetical protein
MTHRSKKQVKSTKSLKKIKKVDVPEVTNTSNGVTNSTPESKTPKNSPAHQLRTLYNEFDLSDFTQQKLDMEQRMYKKEKKKYKGKGKTFLKTLPKEHPLIQIIKGKQDNLYNQWITKGIPVGGVKRDDIQVISDFKQLRLKDLSDVLWISDDGEYCLHDFTNLDCGLNLFFPEMSSVPTINGSVNDCLTDFDRFLTGYESKILNHPTETITEKNIYCIFKQMCRMSTGTTPVGNFPTMVGMFIILESFYETLIRYKCIPGDNFVILDMCTGWGGRLLSSLCIFHRLREEYLKRVGRQLHVTYLTTDPNKDVHDRFKNIILDWFELIEPEDTSEYFHFKKETLGCQTPEFLNFCKTVLSNFGLAGVNVSLTSPPYFDREKYSKDKSQSNLMYPKYPVWRIKFLKGMIDNVHELLIPGGRFYLNISNTYEKDGTVNPMENDTVTFFKESGMNPVNTYKMLLSGSPISVNCVEIGGVPHKYEPIFVFEK